MADSDQETICLFCKAKMPKDSGIVCEACLEKILDPADLYEGTYSEDIENA